MAYSSAYTLLYTMKYWVDGYNLIGKMESISLADKDKEEKLVAWFNIYLERQDRCVLVFDGQGQFNYQVKSQEDKVDIIFTDPEESADTFLIKKMESVQGKHCVWVSSDRTIRENAKLLGKKCLKCEVFMHQFLRRPDDVDHKEQDIGSVDQWLDEFS